MKFLILAALFASACAGVVEQGAYGAPAVVAAPAVATAVQEAPRHYSQSISAAAIRNVETVGVTKTITPVVTKTTTTQTHSEPAVSVGHVQGYTQSSQGSPQVIPVQYNTQYTSYQNPTVGVNGPVTYAGPAVATGLPVAQAAYVQQAAVAQPAYVQQQAYVQQAAVAQPAVYQQQAYAAVAPAYAQAAVAAPAVAAVQPAVYQQAAYAAPALTHAYGLQGGVYSQGVAGLYSVQPSIQALNFAQPQFLAAPAHGHAQVAQGVAYSKY